MRFMCPANFFSKIAPACGLALLATGCASTPAPGGTLSRYPSTPAFAQVVQEHAGAAAEAEQRALLTTWFVDGDPNVDQYCSVMPDGHVTSHRYVFNSAIEPLPKKNLTQSELSDLKQVIARLPASQSPPLPDLLIVSFRSYSTGEWTTRTYDRMHRPAAVSDLFAITGAPIDPP